MNSTLNKKRKYKRSAECQRSAVYYTSKQNQKSKGGKKQTNKKTGFIHYGDALWIRSGAVFSWRYFAPCLPFCVDGVKEWSIKKSEHKWEYFSMFTDLPPAARVLCVFSSGFFSLFHPAQLFFPSFHLGGFTYVLGVERHTISIIRSIDPCRSLIQYLSPNSPNQICWAQLKWV